MKFFLIFLMMSPALIAVAQNKITAANLTGNNLLPNALLTAPRVDKKAEWLKCLGSHIPLKGHLPYYDSVVEFGDEFARDEMEANATFYFEHVFSSKAYRLETHKHNYTGYGCYLFCADRKIGAPALYKVYYRATILVKNNRYYVALNDFTLENQHNEVSFEFLMNKAKDNDTKAKEILAMFHQNNQEQLKKIYSTMSSKNLQATASNW